MVSDIIKEISRKLRKNMTKSEEIVWNFLRNRSFNEKFLRQKPIFLYKENSGLLRYVIPDFCSLEKKLIIEIDGKIHDKLEVYVLDKEKENLLYQKGFKILRIRNEEIIYNIDLVLNKIEEFVNLKQ